MKANEARAALEEVREMVLDWAPGSPVLEPWKPLPSVGRRMAHLLRDPRLNRAGEILHASEGATIREGFATAGVPLRNQINSIRLETSREPFLLALRCADAFGEIVLFFEPSAGRAEAYSVTINRALKGGVSYPSPRPEEQIATRLGQFQIAPVAPGVHDIEVKAVEERVTVRLDGAHLLEILDPDVAGGVIGLGAAGKIVVRSFLQQELLTAREKRARQSILNKMTALCRELDSEREAGIAAANHTRADGQSLTWTYRETGARAVLKAASPGPVTGTVAAGLFGNPFLLNGPFGQPQIADDEKEMFTTSRAQPCELSASATEFVVRAPLCSGSGKEGRLTMEFKLTENATWFCTARVEGLRVSRSELLFGLDETFTGRAAAPPEAGQPAKLVYGPDGLEKTEVFESLRSGFGSSPGASFLLADGCCGHFWKALSGHDTRFELKRICGKPFLALSSSRNTFRWATMWMPYHRLNLTGYKNRMVHFIRYAESPVQEWRERPSPQEYPTDEELERYASNGTRAMVWHHTWASSNFRKREGFVVNAPVMRRAMRKAHQFGISVIPYIGIVPGRHPVLRYQDLAASATYDKNWDLQDFTFYSVASRFAELLPYLTDVWCREYGIDGYYTDGGLAILDWGHTGLSEEQTGMSLEELNDRLYSRVRRALQRNGARFGLENWGGAGIHLAGPWYDCRMIGEGFHEATPEAYRDVYNPLLTATPFKMYAMNLVARNHYNIAMAAVCMTDLQMCSGNYAWGNWPDMASDWANVRPFWAVLDSIEWDDLLDAKPWWAQTLVEGEGFYSGHYTTARRAVVFLANKTEEPLRAGVSIRMDQLPERLRSGRMRWIYPQEGDISVRAGRFEATLPRLHEGPLGLEIVPG